MKLLLDTHVILWYLEDSPLLSPKAKEVIISSENEITVSLISFWEIAIKTSIGKLKLTASIPNMIEACCEQLFDIITLEEKHISVLETLPLYHRDPFDRLLIAQAKAENLIFISKDENIGKYDIQVLW